MASGSYPSPTLNNLSVTGTATFTASPVAPTPTAGDSSTKLATTAFVATRAAAGANTDITSLSLGNAVATTPGTPNKVLLYATTYGFGISSGSLDYLAGGMHSFYVGTTQVAQITSAGISSSVGLTAPEFTGTAANGGSGASFLAKASGNAAVAWWNTSSGTDAGKWDTLVSGTTMYFRALNDAESTFSAWLQVSRSGYTITSINFSITPTAPTASPGDNSTKLATTGFVSAATSSLAPLASPSLTGTPTSPTPTAGDNSTKLATTAYADRAVSQIGASTPLTLSQGGTGGNTAAAARSNILSNRRAVGDASYTTVAGDNYIGYTTTLTAARTLTLPAANTVPAGYSIRIVDETTSANVLTRNYNLTIQSASGSDRLNGATTAVAGVNLTPNARLDVTLISDGSANWLYANRGLTPFAESGTGAGQYTGNAVKIGHSAIGPKLSIDTTDMGRLWTDAYGPASPQGNGYQKLPTGIIIQWGSVYCSADTSFTFPTAFPTAALSVVASITGNPGSSAIVAHVDQLTTTSFTLRPRQVVNGQTVTNPGGNVVFYYIAVGT